MGECQLVIFSYNKPCIVQYVICAVTKVKVTNPLHQREVGVHHAATETCEYLLKVLTKVNPRFNTFHDGAVICKMVYCCSQRSSFIVS